MNGPIAVASRPLVKRTAGRTFSALLLVASVAFGAPLSAMAAEGAQYKLGTADKLRIRVAEWQPADGSIRNWDVINGDYSVGPSGALSLPFIGQTGCGGEDVRGSR